ncbi:DUF2306 domain-containing protein [uncultured Croceitalea sp.]|uniref:DUF2306 domain-containing protein n=1 Tax=uncultured Croceitalea sp. TaxID=1798908 RepID=UPI003305FD6B
MKNSTNKVAWFVFAFMAIGVGLYPLGYLYYAFQDGEIALRLSKSQELLNSVLWNIGFYGHITFGGAALITGWSQFSEKLRKKRLSLHRKLGKVYALSVLVSGVCGVGIAFYATGGVITTLGFLGLGVVWLYTTFKAYNAIKKKDIVLHQGMMIYSYAACFAAVTLRIWLPLLTLTLGSFLPAYQLVAWLCWVPNMVFAYFWVRKKGIVLG